MNRVMQAFMKTLYLNISFKVFLNPGSAIVTDVIQTTLEPLDWLVVVDTFQTSSVIGEEVMFYNVVAHQDAGEGE